MTKSTNFERYFLWGGGGLLCILLSLWILIWGFHICTEKLWDFLMAVAQRAGPRYEPRTFLAAGRLANHPRYIYIPLNWCCNHELSSLSSCSTSFNRVQSHSQLVNCRLTCTPTHCVGIHSISKHQFLYSSSRNKVEHSKHRVEMPLLLTVTVQCRWKMMSNPGMVKGFVIEFITTCN